MAIYFSPHVEFYVKYKKVEKKNHYSYNCFQHLLPFGYMCDPKLKQIEKIYFKCPLKCKKPNRYISAGVVTDGQIDIFLDFVTKVIDCIPQVSFTFKKLNSFYNQANTEKTECVIFVLTVKDWAEINSMVPVMLTTLFRYLDEFGGKIKQLTENYKNDFEKDFQYFQEIHTYDSGHGIKNGGAIISVEQFKKNAVNPDLKTIYSLWTNDKNLTNN
jgi:hypothetical protein